MNIMNAVTDLSEVSQVKKLENPSFYHQAENEFSEILRLLEKNDINIQYHLHMGRDFIEEMILVVQDHFPVNANLFRTAYSRLSKKDREAFRIAHIQPLLLAPFRKRTQELLAHRG